MRLRLLQRNIPGDDFGDAAHPRPGDAIAVKQGVGGDREQANRRERRDAQRQPQLQVDGAAAAYIPPDDIDREQLRLSTEEVRRLIAQSGRYQLVDVGAVNDEAAKAGKLRDCGGCEAKIAAGLDADQSMIGIVTRISRTDYAATYKIRDARSGALVDVEQTDLRAGANSAWSRGARWLIQRRLLEQPN